MTFAEIDAAREALAKAESECARLYRLRDAAEHLSDRATARLPRYAAYRKPSDGPGHTTPADAEYRHNAAKAATERAFAAYDRRDAAYYAIPDIYRP